MPTDQEGMVDTGLAGAPTAQPEQKFTTDTVSENKYGKGDNGAAPVASADVPLVQVAGLGDDVTRKVDEVNQPAQVAAAVEAKAQEPTQDFSKEDQLHAESDNLKRDFLQRVAAARAPEIKPYTPPAVPPRIAEQTRLEMEAGRQRVAEFAEQQASRPRPAPQQDGSMTPVFRPEDYVPNQKKGEGLIASASARTL